MIGKAIKSPTVPIKYTYDSSLDSRPDLKLLVGRASAFLDKEVRNEFNTSIHWELAPTISYGRNGVEMGTVGPIRATITDNDLDISHTELLENSWLDEEHYRYTLRDVWGEYLAARTEKLHDLVFRVGSQESTP